MLGMKSNRSPIIGEFADKIRAEIERMMKTVTEGAWCEDIHDPYLVGQRHALGTLFVFLDNLEKSEIPTNQLVTESEDERIKKSLIKLVTETQNDEMCCQYGCSKSDAITWLEKQKYEYEVFEPVESTLEYKIGFKAGQEAEKQKEPVVDKEGMYYYLEGKFIYCGFPATEENPYDFAMSQQEKQKEQKPSNIDRLKSISTPANENWMEIQKQWEKEDELPDMIKAEFESFRNLLKKKGIDYQPAQVYWEDFARLFLSSAKKYVEQKPEEYPLCNTVKDKIRTYIANHFITDKVVKTDVNSIVKAMEEGVRLGKVEQQPVEWSEEDEEKLKAICTYLRDYSRLAKLGDKLRFNEYCDFLKSLRPSWKPTEEQMKALYEVYYTCSVGAKSRDILESLYNELKKLM